MQLIDAMMSAPATDGGAAHVAEVLQTQIVYNGEVLDIAFDSLKVYKEGTQSLAYLDASVHLAYALLRLLERHARREGEGALVRQKKKRGECGYLWGTCVCANGACSEAQEGSGRRGAGCGGGRRPAGRTRGCR